MKTYLRFLVVALVFLHAFGVAARAQCMGGCARVNITPPVGVWLSGYGSRDKPSDDIEDELFARALVLSDGTTTVAIVSVDLLWVPLVLTEEVRGIVEAKTGIPRQNVMICATHTHFGPKIYRETALGPDVSDNTVDEAYVRTLTRKIADSVFLAHKDMRPVRVGAARGEAAEIVYHRRPKRADGSVSMAFTLPPEVLATREIVRGPDGSVRVTFKQPGENPELTFGPVDPDVWALRVEDAEGDLLASLVNFACHAVSGSAYPDWFYSISADYPGVTMRVVERLEGGVCLFSSGTAGDIVPIERGREPRFQIGRALAGEVVKRLQFVPTSDDFDLQVARTKIELPLKQELDTDRIVDADETEKSLTTEIQALRLGDIYVLGLPGEILVEVGLEIKKKAGVEKLIVASLSNDVIGYVCHRQAYEEGGYEPNAGTNLAPGAAEAMIEQALKLIEQLKHPTPEPQSR